MRGFNLLVLTLVAPLPAGAQPSNERAAEDAAAIRKAYDEYRGNEYRELFQRTFFGNEFEDRVRAYEEHISALEDFETDDAVELSKLLTAFEETYGSDAAAIRGAFKEVNDNGGSVAGDPAYDWSELRKIVAAPAETRTRLAESLVELGGTGGRTAQGYDRLTVDESFDRAKAYLELALKYDPENAEAKDALANIEESRSGRHSADREAIEAGEFPSHAESFQGDAASMARTALEYLRTRNVGVEGELIAVRVAGDWQPYDTLLGVTVNWGLPVEAAYRTAADPELALVVSMRLISRDEDPEPPFQRFVITGDRTMLAANVPGAGGAGFGLMRIPLALCLILLGVLAAAPLLREKVPALCETLDAFAPRAAMVGVVTLCVGVSAVLLGILSPFRDLLPQAAAIVLGLSMGLDILLRKDEPPAESTSTNGEGATAEAAESSPEAPTGATEDAPNQPNSSDGESTSEDAADSDAADPDGADLGQRAREVLDQAGDAAGQAVAGAQELLRRNEQSLRALDQFRVPLGIGGFVLGVVHLVFGGAWLI